MLFAAVWALVTSNFRFEGIVASVTGIDFLSLARPPVLSERIIDLIHHQISLRARVIYFCWQLPAFAVHTSAAELFLKKVVTVIKDGMVQKVFEPCPCKFEVEILNMDFSGADPDAEIAAQNRL